MPANSDFLTVREAADFLRVSPLTLANWRSRGEGPPWVRISQKVIRCRRASLMAFLETLETTDA